MDTEKNEEVIAKLTKSLELARADSNYWYARSSKHLHELVELRQENKELKKQLDTK